MDIPKDSGFNDTLLNMVSNLKPKFVRSELISLDLITPVKRRASLTESFDGCTSKKAKHDISFDASYVSSPTESRRMRSDLREARNTIFDLENRIKHMHNVRKEMQLMFDNETLGLQKQHTRDQKSVEELESQLQTIRKREKTIKEEFSEVKNKLDIVKLTSNTRIEALEKSLADLREATMSQENERKHEIENLKQKVNELKLLSDAAEADAQAQKNLASELETRLSEKNGITRELDMKEQALLRLRLELKDLEYVKENYIEYQQQAKSQQHKLAAYADIERENNQLKEESKKLKDAVRNKLLLEEEVHALKNRLVNYKEQELKLVASQSAQAQNEVYLNEWRSVARGICETSGPDSSLPQLMRSCVENLQRQEVTLTAEKIHLDSELNTAIHDAKLARSELDKNLKLMSELQAGVQQRDTLIHRMQKKLLLVSRERDSYRLQLDCYERDLTMCLTTTGQTNVQQTQRDRIESLERICEGYRDMIAKLENELQNVEPNIHSESVPIREEQLARLKYEIEQLRDENECLRARRDQLEIQLEGCNVGVDSEEGRIVHLTNNPLAECVAQRDALTEKLQEEVERLKRKIHNMEEGLEGSKLGDMSMTVKEVITLKEQLKSSETQTQRLKEYFKTSLQEFRNVIYMLLGYKIDKSSNSQYKLTSMYAEQVEDQLCFQFNSEGALNLLENRFSATLEEMVELHLRHQKSIPVFLSALTMDLFNNRTLGTKTFEIDNE